MKTDNQKAFTLIEVVMAMAIILILAGALLTGGKFLRTRAEAQLTQSAIEVIGAAMEQYYEAYKVFPFETVANFGESNYTVVPTLPSPGTVAGGTTEEIQKNGVSFSNASSALLFYYLDKNSNCRQLLDAIAARMITNKDAKTGVVLTVDIGLAMPVDLPRFIDAWGMSLRYEYMSGYSFPVITSAGPDKIFDTEDDLSSQ
jgi:prepilin-type N-terminal cleavage/methylation domain-containing protein